MTNVTWIKRHSLEIQFWGYETGNIIASITGAGGMKAFFESLADAYRTGGASPAAAILWLARETPEVFATLGVIAIVVIAWPLGNAVRRRFGPMAADAINALAVPLALGLLGYALVRNANLFTVAACAFVVGSCLLRGAAHFPLLLKLGGLALSLGGLALAAAGVMVLAVQLFGPGGTGLALSAATFLSGVFVAGAGLLTYQGGCFAVDAAREAGDADNPRSGILAALLATSGALASAMARHVDPPVRWCIRWLVHPGLFWIPEGVKQRQPFLTSMLARLPWRVITGSLALATGTAAGMAFAIANLLWAVGDMAIGSLDAKTAEDLPLAGSEADVQDWLAASGEDPQRGADSRKADSFRRRGTSPGLSGLSDVCAGATRPRDQDVRNRPAGRGSALHRHVGGRRPCPIRARSVRPGRGTSDATPPQSSDKSVRTGRFD